MLKQAKNVLMIPSGALSTGRGNASSASVPGAPGAPSSAAVPAAPNAAVASAPVQTASNAASRAASEQAGKLYTVRVAKGEPGKQTIEERQVRIGLNNRVHAEVLEGLQEGEQVVVGDASANESAQMRRGPRVF